MHKLYAHNRIITMQKIFPSKKKAFSLVELSMVIIVIGLLISGVTAGGSLVKNSRISSARSITLSSQIVTIPGMVLWLENSAKDSFSASQINGGAQITNWYNREPSNYLVKNNLTTTASNNVLYQDTSTNNIPAVNMNVTGNMTLANFAGSTLATSTVVIVFKPTSQTSGTAMVIADSGASANTTCSIGIKNNAVSLNAGNAVDSSTTTNPASFTMGNSYILMVYFNGANSKVFANNITEVGGAGAILGAGTNALDGLTIGANKSGANGIAAEISEVIVYNRVLKDTEKNDVMGYLSKKYKISVTGA